MNARKLFSTLPLSPRVPLRMAAIINSPVGDQDQVRYFRTQASPAQVRVGEHWLHLGRRLESQGLQARLMVDDTGAYPMWAALEASGCPQGEEFAVGVGEPCRLIRVAVALVLASEGVDIAIHEVAVTEQEVQAQVHLQLAQDAARERPGVFGTVFAFDELEPAWASLALPARAGAEAAQEVVALTNQASVALQKLRQVLPADGLAEIRYAEGVSLVVRPRLHDRRVEIACEGLGSTTVNYRQDGLTLDVAAEGASGPMATYAVDADELAAEEAAPETPAQGARP